MADGREGPRACSVVLDSLQPQGLKPTRLLCPWDSPGKGTGGGCHFLLQGIFPIWGSNLHLCVSCIGRQIPYLCATWKALQKCKGLKYNFKVE